MRIVALALAMLACVATSALAQNIGVMPVKGTNLTEGETAAIGTLIASAYSAQVEGRVFGPDETGPVLAQSGTEKDAAMQLVLAEYITITTMKLDARIAIDATIYNKHGSRLYQARATAMSLDDMQSVSERIAMSLHRRTEIEHTQTLDNVTEKEAKRPTRTFAENVVGVRTGVVFPFVADLDTAPMMMVQFDMRLEGANYFIEFAAGLMLPSDFNDDANNASVGGLIGLLGGSYYLTHTSVSPYLSAGISPRLVGGDYSGAGLALGGGAGVMFMRQASTRIYVEARVDQNVLPLSTRYQSYDSLVDVEGNDVYPTELSVAVGIGW